MQPWGLQPCLRLQALPAPSLTLGSPPPPRAALGLHQTQVLVNRQVEGQLGAPLRTGDVVDLYPEVAPAPPLRAPQPRRPVLGANAVVPAPPGLPTPGAGRSNVVPLGALKRATAAS